MNYDDLKMGFTTKVNNPKRLHEMKTEDDKGKYIMDPNSPHGKIDRWREVRFEEYGKCNQFSKYNKANIAKNIGSNANTYRGMFLGYEGENYYLLIYRSAKYLNISINYLLVYSMENPEIPTDEEDVIRILDTYTDKKLRIAMSVWHEFGINTLRRMLDGR